MPLTTEEYEARIATLEGQLAPLAAERDALQGQVTTLTAEVARLTALVPPDSDGTSSMTVGEYRHRTLAAYRAIGLKPSDAAGTALKAKWTWMMQGLETTDQARRINPRVAPFLQLTAEMFTDGLITQATKTALDTYGL